VPRSTTGCVEPVEDVPGSAKVIDGCRDLVDRRTIEEVCFKPRGNEQRWETHRILNGLPELRGAGARHRADQCLEDVTG
jgi:hypothetical protein